MLGEVIHLPWLILGDFNQILYSTEKRGGRPSSVGSMNAFGHMVRECALINLGYSGIPFTWSNMRKGVANIQECLDRAFGNRLWFTMYGSTRVTHLPRSRSDQTPLLLRDTLLPSPPNRRPFRVQAAWFQHSGFEPFLTRYWENIATMELIPTMTSVQHTLGQWNRNVFGNIFDRKSRCLARLAGVQRKLAVGPSSHLQQLEETLRLELDSILAQKETYWRQKWRISWLKAGEWNSKFFHTSTLIRRRRNHIVGFRQGDGSLCEDPSLLKEMSTKFYKRLYTKENCMPCNVDEWTFKRLLHGD